MANKGRLGSRTKAHKERIGMQNDRIAGDSEGIYTSSLQQIKTHKYVCTHTNTDKQIQIHKYMNTNTLTFRTERKKYRMGG